MRPEGLPPHYDDLDAALAHAWQLLGRGAADRRSPMHTPVVATSDALGKPDARIMVLREARQSDGHLRFHTDSRSDKARLIGSGAAVSVLAYHPGENIQLRLSGTARIDSSSETRAQAWARTSLYGRRCYLGEVGPGGASDMATSGLPTELEGIEPTTERTLPGLANFALVWVDVRTIEWLFLAHVGHRRARFERGTGHWTGRWLIP
jgi:pyridoxamine 5'-phosphate oxidase